MKYFIYKTTCKINNKIYIGKSNDKRPKSYLGSGILLKKAIKKYGRINFTREILESVESEEIAYELEKTYIKKYNSQNNLVGYNIHLGGNGYDHSVEYNQDYITEEYKQKVREASQTMWDNMPAEEKQQRCDLVKKSWTPERKAARKKMMQERLSDPVKSKEYKQKLSEAVNASNKRQDVIQRRKDAMSNIDLRERIKKNSEWMKRCPHYKTLNKEVSQPLSTISRLLKNGKITKEEAYIKREEIAKKKIEIRSLIDEWKRSNLK